MTLLSKKNNSLLYGMQTFNTLAVSVAEHCALHGSKPRTGFTFQMRPVSNIPTKSTVYFKYTVDLVGVLDTGKHF